ncbi:MAG: hypothetical protein IMZ46_13595, partial [Acidobacteria bacterium]|nr:hypothetical protein [Acidobacteriota bacterium]
MQKEENDTDNDTVMKVEPDTEPESEKPSKKKPAPKGKEKKDKAPRKPKGRVSDMRDAGGNPKSSPRRSSGSKEPGTPRVPTKRQANGQPKNLAISAAKEKRILAEMELLDAEAAEEEDDGDLFAEEAEAYQLGSAKRRRTSADSDSKRNKTRRSDIVDAALGHVGLHTDMGKRRYDELYYEDALNEVREREVFAEKERKKDMQRKRRREKSMAATIEQKEAALAKARAAGDETERQKHLREAARAGKKAEQTKLVLQNGFKGPVRGFVDQNPDGGTMTTFQASDIEPGKKGKGRGGSRPKKSKEQKLAEKASAEAAQAALDAGEDLPPPKEEGRIRIKSSKKRKEQQAAEVDKENKEPKAGKDKEKAEPSPESKFQSKGYNQIYDQI